MELSSRNIGVAALAVGLVFGFSFLLTGCGASTSKESAAPQVPTSYKVGDVVAAKWQDGSWYKSKITAVNGDKYDLTFDDGTYEKDYTVSQLKTIPTSLTLKVGDSVLAVYSDSGIFYPGKVQELETGGAVVKWDDGSGVTNVKFGSIIKN